MPHSGSAITTWLQRTTCLVLSEQLRPPWIEEPVQLHDMVLGARRLLGDKLPCDIFVEHTADQDVIGHSLSSSTVLERLKVHLREMDGQALRLRQRLTGCLL